MFKRFFVAALVFLALPLISFDAAEAFWVFTPRDRRFVNPKHAVKDTPQEQFNWAMKFYEAGDFKRAAEEFTRLTESYRDSSFAPDAQYYAARSYEEQGRYWFAYQNYKKTVMNYPYTERMDEIIARLYNLGNLMAAADTAVIMGIELSLSLERAVEIYKTVIENSPFSPYADKALMEMAAVKRRMQKYPEAIQAYDRVISDYPESQLVDEARYQLAFTRYEASLHSEYDQEGTAEALREFEKISTEVHIPGVSEKTTVMLAELRERKAESAMNIAEFYERQGQFTSAVIYYDNVVGNFPGTEAAKDAQKRIDVLEKRMGRR